MQRLIRIFLINLGFIVGGLILAELIFGNWIFGPDYSVLNVPRNETRYFDVSEFIKRGKVTTYTRDEHGLRGTYGGDPAEIDVLVVGGSTTNERFLHDQETWVAQLQERFKASGKDLRIINAAVDGQSTRGHIKAFDLWFLNIPGLKPKFVIAYVGINDVAVGADRNKFDEMQSPDAFRQMRQYIMNHSILYNQFRRIRGSFVAQRTRLMHGGNAHRTGVWIPVTDWVDQVTLREEHAQALRNYQLRLRTLTSRIKRFGAKPIYVTQRRGDYRFVDGELEVLVQPDQVTDTFKPSDRTLAVMSLFNEMTLSICAEMKLTCIDLDGDIELGGRDFYDAVHTMPSGSAKVADFLHERLKGVLR